MVIPPFTCNICGVFNAVAQSGTEPASCLCGSNVRSRALIHLLSLELFGRSLILKDFPKLRAIRGIGMSDKESYANLLADKFDYTNTYYDRDPKMDFTEPHPQLWGAYDFLLSSDVFEHVAPPVQRAFDEVQKLLSPTGFLVMTVPCFRPDDTREHFPELHQYRVVPVGDSDVLVNRRRDGTLEVSDGLIFHGGTGATLEMREFGMAGLKRSLSAAHFRDVEFLVDDRPQIGIVFDEYVSRPLVARKDPYAMSAPARGQLIDLWRTEREQSRLASRSRWLRLGRHLGLGPKFTG